MGRLRLGTPLLLFSDVIKSLGTVDRGILGKVLGSLGLPGWFRHACFEYRALVRSRFKLAAGLGEPWTRDGGIPQGCPLSMMFLWLCICLGVGILLLMKEFSLSYMLIILNAYLGILTCSSMLFGSPLGMSGWLVKSLLPVSVSL